MRALFLCVLLLGAPLLGAPLASHGAGVELTRVWPSWRDAESFERISEFFSGKENTGGEIILRTQPAVRDGYYFLVRLHNPGAALPGVKFALQVIAPDGPRPKTYTFSTALPAGKTVFDLGITGADWIGKKTQPVAWKLELLGADGQPVAVAKSFLWEKPAK